MYYFPEDTLHFAMATLYVKNVPNDLYRALKKRARGNCKSIAAEVLLLLKANIPTAAELKRRKKLFEDLKQLRSVTSVVPGPFPSSEEMVRDDRERGWSTRDADAIGQR
jgi:plasmid stability protein